jgi:phospholipid/cholesterol/gamma-HCH transport system permease protein
MVFALQSAVNMARFGPRTTSGPISALAILRELGPVLTAILVGGKVASGITAELGSMMVTEQIDALRTLGVNFVKRLIVPRCWRRCWSFRCSRSWPTCSECSAAW